MKPGEQLASNGPPISDSIEKKVSIAIEIKGGKLMQFGGEPLPDCTDCIGDLVLPAFAIKDPAVLQRLTEERVELLFGDESQLLCRVSGRRVPQHLLARCKQVPVPYTHQDGAFVEVVLDEPLMIRYRGNKRAVLEPVKCHIPALGDLGAESLNEAYRKISEKFEPTRRSFGGNVFLNVFRYVEANKEWRPIGEMRGDLIYVPK